MENSRRNRKRVIHVTRNLRERVGRARKKTPCASRLKHGRCQIEIAHRTWEDHYQIHDENGRWLASFQDCSTNKELRVAALTTAEGVSLRFEETPTILFPGGSAK